MPEGPGINLGKIAMGRRLAAIMAADMAGYSRLMEQDEEDIIARQKVAPQELFDPEIASRGGRIVKTTGDGVLVEFTAAQDAVRCAVNIQMAMSGREEAHRPKIDRILYRVGINLGDVIFDEGDVFGDGVNVASRLEGLAKPGGVCISDIVHQAIGIGSGTVSGHGQPASEEHLPAASGSGSGPPTRRPQVAEPWSKRRASAGTVRTASDGVQIAWAGIGAGAPVLKAPNWLNHIEYEWRSPIWRPGLARLASFAVSCASTNAGTACRTGKSKTSPRRPSLDWRCQELPPRPLRWPPKCSSRCTGNTSPKLGTQESHCSG